MEAEFFNAFGCEKSFHRVMSMSADIIGLFNIETPNNL